MKDRHQTYFLSSYFINPVVINPFSNPFKRSVFHHLELRVEPLWNANVRGVTLTVLLSAHGRASATAASYETQKGFTLANPFSQFFCFHFPEPAHAQPSSYLLLLTWRHPVTSERAAEEVVRWQHRLNGHESEQTVGPSGGQRSLVCCSPWGGKESTQLMTGQTKTSLHKLYSVQARLFFLRNIITE